MSGDEEPIASHIGLLAYRIKHQISIFSAVRSTAAHRNLESKQSPELRHYKK
jgi:hypothetical protein